LKLIVTINKMRDALKVIIITPIQERTSLWLV